jgi:pimeloyl-ACP methyl ester carboxylesterase
MPSFTTRFKTEIVNGLEVFYREAGDPQNPTLLLLHGFPTSSHMFRNLITELSDEYHLVAPDYIGFGNSAAPTVEEFQYSFANLTDVVDGLTKQLDLQRFAIYIQDYGAPIGLSIASRSPERVTAIVSQSGNAYMAGFTPFWDILFAHAKDRAANEEAVRKLLQPKTTRWQYTHGVPSDRLDRIAPETWRLDQSGMDRPGATAAAVGLPVQPRPLPRLPRILPHTPATHPAHLGTLRRNLRRRRCRSVPHRPAERRTAPSRRRPLRPRNTRRRDRRTDPALPAPTSLASRPEDTPCI